MTGYLDNSKSQNQHIVSFDYTHFLCEASHQHLSFFEAMLAPFVRLKRPSDVELQGRFPSEIFTSLVSQSLSSLNSDVSNLVTLINEAKKQEIKTLTVFLPYALDEAELALIRQKTAATIEQHSIDREYLQVTL